MAASTDRRSLPNSDAHDAPTARNAPTAHAVSSGTAHRLSGIMTRVAPTPSTRGAAPEPQVQLNVQNVRALQERRCRRRAQVLPMYTAAIVRVISHRDAPLDAHVIDLGENGMAVEVDYPLPVGQAVTVEFRVAGLGRLRKDQWSELTAAAQVVRQDNLDDFPGGPYKIGLRFVRISTMTRAQIARFVATQPG